MTRVPKTAEEMTPEWLTKAFHEAGVLEAGARVTACELENTGVGRGFAGVTLRGWLSYEPTAAGPESFVAKLPTVLEVAREEDLALIASIYANEINFYRHLAPQCPARVPRHFWSGSEPDDGRYCLLIEDMCDLRMAETFASCTSEDAHLAVSTLARFHARWWHDEQLTGQEWLSSSDASGRLLEGMCSEGWDHLWAAHGDVLPAEFEASGRALSARVAELVEEGTSSAWTLVHGDYRLENLLFDDDHADPLVVLDWQTVSWGSGLRDLGLFMGQSLRTDLRRAREPELLQRYHEMLQEHGVNGYPFDQMMRDYCLGLVLATVFPALNSRMLAEQKKKSFDYLGPEQQEVLARAFERGDAMIREAAIRNVAAILDNGAQELI